MHLDDVLQALFMDQAYNLFFLLAVAVKVQVPVRMALVHLFPYMDHAGVVLLLVKAAGADGMVRLQGSLLVGRESEGIVDLLQVGAVGAPCLLVFLGEDDEAVQSGRGFLIAAEAETLPFDEIAVVGEVQFGHDDRHQALELV